MPFAPGISGNPQGRPKNNRRVKDIRAFAQRHTRAAIEVLRAIIDDLNAPHTARVSAAQIILDRGYGKPAQSTEVVGGITVTHEHQLTSIGTDLGKRGNGDDTKLLEHPPLEPQPLAEVDTHGVPVRHDAGAASPPPAGKD